MKNKLIYFLLFFLFSCQNNKNEFFSKEIIPDQIRFLMLDDRNIEESINTKLVLGNVIKHPENPLFVEDMPWEKRFDNLYGNIIFDEDDSLYKCWYSPFIVDYSAQGMTLEQRQKPYDDNHPNREMGICYAYSKDGIHWEKPNLGLVEYNGNKNNNIVWRGPHGAGIFKDKYEKDPNKKYKILYQGIFTSFSKDGINWESPIPIKGVDVAGDTHNNAFWAPTLKKYVGITRTWRKDPDRWYRQVARIESSDFINWTKEQVVFEGNGITDQTYAMPVFYHAGVYLGLLAVYNGETDKTTTELTWSPDTKVWNRISPGKPLIPNSEKVLDHDYGCIYACTVPIFLKDEIRLYYGGSDYLHFGWRNGSLSLATLRPDGFAGLSQDNNQRKSQIKTKSILIDNKELRISGDVNEGGYIKVTILDDDNTVLAVSQIINKNVTDEPLVFNKSIKKGNIKLQFDFSKSTIFSYSFGKN